MTYDPLCYHRSYNDGGANDGGEVFHPNAPSRGFYLVAGVIGAIVIALGVLFFAGSTSERSDIADAPATVDSRLNDTRTPPVPTQLRPQE